MEKSSIEKELRELHEEIKKLKESGLENATAKQLAEYLVKVDELTALMLAAEKIIAENK